ncbi:hypothetical protein [Selenomonas sp. AE3005]|nr:hypothetical protein [Selenomonas sp. AE3005]
MAKKLPRRLVCTAVECLPVTNHQHTTDCKFRPSPCGVLSCAVKFSLQGA